MTILAQASPVYKPAMRAILSITNAYPASVTTTLDGTNPGNHNYIDGLIVRLDIPLGFGMQQANQLSGTIVVTGATTFNINIDTTHFDPYVISAVWPYSAQIGQAVPFAEDNAILTGAVQNVLPY